VRWLNRRVGGGRSRSTGAGATSLLEAIGFVQLEGGCEAGANDPQEACRCSGSSDVKMSVCGGGVYAVWEEREGYSSNVRWKKYAGIRVFGTSTHDPPT
jgi:hypothetical protein